MIKLDYKIEGSTFEEKKKKWEEILKPWISSIMSFAQAAKSQKRFTIELKDIDDNVKKIFFPNGIPQDIYDILSDDKKILAILLFSCINLKKDSDIPDFLKILYNFTNNPKKTKAKDKNNNHLLIKCLFNYELFKDGKTLKWNKTRNLISSTKEIITNNCWSQKKLCELLDVHTCVYCNLEYVSNLDTKISRCDIFEEPKPEEKITRIRGDKSKKAKDWDTAPLFDSQDLLLKGQKYKTIKEPKKYHLALDHILSQEEYPFFSISPFNLVPVCTRCNSIKSNRIFPHSYYLYPYEVSFHDIAHFQFYFSKVNCLSKPDVGSVKVYLVENDNNMEKEDFTRATHTSDLFCLKDRISQGHSDYICEILMKCIEYPRDYIFSLRKSPYNISYKDIQRLIFGNYTTQENINKRPLAKVTIDMIRQYEHLFWMNDDEVDETIPSWNS